MLSLQRLRVDWSKRRLTGPKRRSSPHSYLDMRIPYESKLRPHGILLPLVHVYRPLVHGNNHLNIAYA